MRDVCVELRLAKVVVKVWVWLWVMVSDESVGEKCVIDGGREVCV